MWETSKDCQSQIKRLTWNGASIIVATLDCIMILKALNYMSRTLVNKITKQILATIRGKLAFEVLTSSKSFYKQ